MAYTTVLEAVAARRAGSSPVPSTINQGQNFLTFGVLESGTVKRAS
jgi:hypothetical protein